MDALTFTRILYIVCFLFSSSMYILASNSQKKKYKKGLDYIREHSVRLIRVIDLKEQFEILTELHELQQEQPNVSRSDMAMMNIINENIQKTAQQLRYLENKNEPSKTHKSESDNSIYQR